MSETPGFIVLSRKMFGGDDPLWPDDREYTRAEAWIDLIQDASWRPRTRLIDGETVQIERGQLIASQRFLAERWNWTRKRVRGFLDLLERMGRVNVDSNHQKAHLGSIITLVDYDDYQYRPSKKAHQRARRGPTEGPNKIELKELKGIQQGSLEVEKNGTIEAVWNHYISTYADRFSEGRAKRLKLDSAGRPGKIKARLREGYSQNDLCRAIDGYFESDWHVERGKVELEYILRNQSSVEEGLTKADQAEERRDPHQIPGP